MDSAGRMWFMRTESCMGCYIAVIGAIVSVCNGQLFPPWYPANMAFWASGGPQWTGWGAGIAGGVDDDLYVPPISHRQSDNFQRQQDSASIMQEQRTVDGPGSLSANIGLASSSTHQMINDITSKSTSSSQSNEVSSSQRQREAIGSATATCETDRSPRAEKERQIYMFSCAQIPKGLRDYVGCPLELPFDLSFNKVEGYASIEDEFVNEDLKQSTQLVEGDIRSPSTKDILGIRHICGNKGLWAGGVPYTIDNKTFSQDQMDYITTRMCNISSSTCIRFFPRTNEKDYLAIVSHTGCWSFIGRQGGKQLLSLEILNKNGQSCLNGTTVEHELLHALGFVHEHTRLDRDSYIKIELDNVEPRDRDQFGKYTRQFISVVPYDTASVLHYSSAAFALNLTLPVITLLQAASATNATELLIQPAAWLSELDVERINELYGCTPRPQGITSTTTAAPLAAPSCVDPLLTGNDDRPDPNVADTCALYGSASGSGVG